MVLHHTPVALPQGVDISPQPEPSGCGFSSTGTSRLLALHGVPLQPGQQHVELFVEPAARGAGVGTALLAAIEQAARADGATRLTCGISAADAGALAFAQRRGFALDYEMLDGTLDLAQFDPARWQSCIAEAEWLGVRFTTLLQVQDDPTFLQKLYELDRSLSGDVSEWSGVMPPFESYCAAVRACDPEAVIIAWREGAPVGYIYTTPAGYTEFLGVLPRCRGLRIALVLKVLTADWAIHQGLKQLTTNNNAASTAVIRLNQKLGYVMRPGWTYLAKQ